jgi:hypothetical protein
VRNDAEGGEPPFLGKGWKKQPLPEKVRVRRRIIGSSSLLVHPTESGSAYPKENKAVDRMSGTTGQAFIKSVDIVSIWLKSGGLLPFGPSSCTKSEDEPLM